MFKAICPELCNIRECKYCCCQPLLVSNYLSKSLVLFVNPNMPLSSQAPLFTAYKPLFMPCRHKHYLVAYSKCYLDGKLCKIDYGLWPGRPQGLWRCVELSAPSLNGPRQLCFSSSHVCFLLFSASSLLPIYCAFFISHQFWPPKNVSPKN